MDDQGRVSNRELAAQKIGVVDIGFRTTDFAIMDRLRHIDRGCRTIDSGMSKAFGLIAQRFRKNAGWRSSSTSLSGRRRGRHPDAREVHPLWRHPRPGV